MESDPDGESEVGPNLLRSGLLRPVLMFMLFPTFFLGLLNMGVYYSRQRTWLEIFLFGGLNILLALFMFWLLKRKDRLVLGLQPGGWCMALIVSFLGGAALMFLIERL